VCGIAPPETAEPRVEELRALRNVAEVESDLFCPGTSYSSHGKHPSPDGRRRQAGLETETPA